MNNVLIFRSGILPQTQTFILNQTNALTRYHPYFVGLAPSQRTLLPPGTPAFLLTNRNSGLARLKKAAYRITGFSPSFHAQLKALAPSLIHAHFAEDGPMVLSMARALNIPLIVTLHGSIEPLANRDLLKSLHRAIYLLKRRAVWRQAAMFICVSEFIRDIALQAGYPKDKLAVHYIGIDLSAFPYHPASGRDPNLVLFVGRLEEKKGCRHAIEAMSIVKKQAPNARLVIIGDGSLRPSLEQYSQELKVNASFMGTLPPADIREWMRKSRVFCAPSIRASDGNSEALGMVFAEAASSGLPVVSFQHGGIPEVVRNGETGLLVKERDVAALADNLLRVLNEDDLWQQLSARGSSWVHERFDIGTQTGKLEDLYDQVLAEHLRHSSTQGVKR